MTHAPDTVPGASASAGPGQPGLGAWLVLTLLCLTAGLVTAAVAFDAIAAAIAAARPDQSTPPHFVDGDRLRAGTGLVFLLAVAATSVAPPRMLPVTWAAVVAPYVWLSARDYTALELAGHGYNIMAFGPLGDSLLFPGVPAAIVLLLAAGVAREIRSARARRAERRE